MAIWLGLYFHFSLFLWRATRIDKRLFHNHFYFVIVFVYTIIIRVTLTMSRPNDGLEDRMV